MDFLRLDNEKKDNNNNLDSGILNSYNTMGVLDEEKEEFYYKRH